MLYRRVTQPKPFETQLIRLVLSDTHLGHIRNLGFIRRIVARLNQLRPDVIFIAGDRAEAEFKAYTRYV